MQGLAIPTNIMQQLAQACINVVGNQAMQVPAPQAVQHLPSQKARPTPPTVQLQPSQQAQGSAQPPAMQQGAPPGPSDPSKEVIHVREKENSDEEMTDMSDSEAERDNANSDKPPVERKKKGTRAAKKEKEEKKKKAATAKPQVQIQKLAKK